MRACMLLSTVLQIRVNVTKPWLHFQSISMHASIKDEQMLHRTCGNWTEASVFLRLHIVIDVNVVDKIQFNFSLLSSFQSPTNFRMNRQSAGNFGSDLVTTPTINYKFLSRQSGRRWFLRWNFLRLSESVTLLDWKVSGLEKAEIFNVLIWKIKIHDEVCFFEGF